MNLLINFNYIYAVFLFTAIINIKIGSFHSLSTLVFKDVGLLVSGTVNGVYLTM
jgi:hypothetical protein